MSLNGFFVYLVSFVVNGFQCRPIAGISVVAQFEIFPYPQASSFTAFRP